MKSSRIITVLLISVIATSVIAIDVKTTTTTAVAENQPKNLKSAFIGIPAQCAILMVDAVFRFAAYLDSFGATQEATTTMLRQSAPSNTIRKLLNEEELSSCSKNI